MQFIKERSDLPVPRVFGYDTDEENPVGSAYILMEFLPGIAAMDALGGYKVHHGVIARDRRQNFYRSVANCHVHPLIQLKDSSNCLAADLAIQVQITSLCLPKIGTIVRNSEGGYESGPIPGIGGPFDTATAFFEAWADNVKFKRGKEEIMNIMKLTLSFPPEKMVEIIKNFPSQMKAIASQLSSYNEGPFPLDHDDFLHSNIMVNEDNFDVTGVIDWEGACTVPWELIGFPEFLSTLPACLGLPENYDQHGQPLD